MRQDSLHRGRGAVIRRLLGGSEYRRDVLRTNLWLVPAIEVLCAGLLFIGTYALDRAAYDGVFQVPSWAISGSADVARYQPPSCCRSLQISLASAGCSRQYWPMNLVASMSYRAIV